MSSSVQKKIRQAEKFVELNEYTQAIAIYMDILEKFPNNIKALHAIKILKASKTNKPINTSKSKGLNDLLQKYNNREFNSVIEKADELLKIYPNEYNLHNIQGASYAAIDKFERAIRCYENILKIDPNSAKAYFNIAVMYDKLASPKNAIKNYKNAIKIKPDYADAQNNMGSAYKELGDLDIALNAYQKATQIQPNHAFAYNNMGNIYMTGKSFDKAIMAFDMAIIFNPNYADAYNSLGIAYLNKKNITEAQKAFEKVLLINPNHVKGLLNMGSFHEGNAEYEKSIQLYSKAHMNDPENNELLALKVTQQAYICDIDEIKNHNSKIKHAYTNKYHVRPFDSFAQDDEPERHQLRAISYTNKYFGENRYLSLSNSEK
jgi:tetratricopeptide (TPR) repeat protein